MKVKQFSRHLAISRAGGDEGGSYATRAGTSRRTDLAAGDKSSPVAARGRVGFTRVDFTRAAPRRGSGLPERRQECSRLPLRPIRSCILIFYYGGPSHIDTYDMKPNAPAEIRGQFGSIATSVPGIRVCEHLPRRHGCMDRLAIVRSMHHPMTNHNAAAFTALCGRDPLKGDLELLSNDRNDPPCYGAILSATMRERPGLPTFVALPHVMYNVVQLPGQVAGFPGFSAWPFSGQRRSQRAGFSDG